MPTVYARCNAMLSLALDENGNPCRYMSKGTSEQEVIDDMSSHLKNVHSVDPDEILSNLKGVMKTTRR